MKGAFVSRTEIYSRLDVSTLKPRADYVLMRVFKRDLTEGGIHLPKKENNACTFGEIIATGTGTVNNHDGKPYELPYTIGERVICMDYVGDRMHIDEEEYRWVREHGIWCKIEIEGPENAFRIKAAYPTNDCLLIDPEDETKTISGILYTPNRDRQTWCRLGTVEGVGPGLRNVRTGKVIPLEVVPEDRVLFTRYAGAIINVDGKELRLLQLADITAIIEEEA